MLGSSRIAAKQGKHLHKVLTQRSPVILANLDIDIIWLKVENGFDSHFDVLKRLRMGG